MAEQALPRLKLFRLLVAIAITLAVIAVMTSYVGGVSKLLASVGAARWQVLLLVLVVISTNVWLSVVRWALVLRAMGTRLPLKRLFGVVMATWPLAVVLPSRAGDFARSLHIRDATPMLSGASSVLAEKIVDVQSLSLLALAGCTYYRMWTWALVAAGILVSGWVGLYFIHWIGEGVARVPVLRRYPDKVQQVFTAFTALRSAPWWFVVVSVVSVLSWLTAILQAFLCLRMMGVDAPFGVVVSLWPIAVFVGLLPLTMAGMGTRDAAFLLLLQGAGVGAVEPSAVLAATLTYALISTWLPAIFGLPFLWRLGVGGRPEKTKASQGLP